MKKVYAWFLLLVFGLFLMGCTSAKGEYQLKIEQDLQADQTFDHYRVFYQIFIGSFSDSNNDGIGDIKGIIKRFNYLNDGNLNSGKSLGVEGIWLSPMMPSQTYHKYDVKDYYDIDPQFGTLDDFKDLLALAKQRNVKIIIDLVVNHTSANHPWFLEYKKSYRNNDLDNPYRNYYTTYHENQLDSNRVCYPIYSGSQYYYEANFSSTMPELNFDNPDVKDEFENIIKFWLEMGVDGFRLDATKYVYYNDTEKNISFWNWFMETAKKYNEDVYVIGETWSSESEILTYYENFNNFDFDFSQAYGYISQAAQTIISVDDYTQTVESYLDKVYAINQSAIISPFISNHDMDRSAGYLSLTDGIMYMAANLYILGPGNPFIYYGEEIGLKGSRGSSTTDANRRLRMLWGDKDKIINPVGSSYNEKLQINGTVKSQKGNKNSLYNHYKKLIQIRKAYPEIARGTYQALQTDIYTVGGFISTYNNSKVLVIHNTGFETKTIDISYLLTNGYETLIFVGLGNAIISSDLKLAIDGQTSVIIK